MSQTSKKISLSQGLKFVERLTRLVNDEQHELARQAQPVVVSFASEKSKVEENQAQVEAKLAEIESMYGALTTLRTAIGAKNSEIGLHSLLAQQAVLRSRKSGLENLISTQTYQPNSIELSLVDEALVRLERKDELPKISIKVLSGAKLEELAGQVRDIDRQIMVINDEVHRLNGTTQITLELPTVIAEQIGLFA